MISRAAWPHHHGECIPLLVLIPGGPIPVMNVFTCCELGRTTCADPLLEARTRRIVDASPKKLLSI
jgi:hypothetical protein